MTLRGAYVTSSAADAYPDHAVQITAEMSLSIDPSGDDSACATPARPSLFPHSPDPVPYQCASVNSLFQRVDELYGVCCGGGQAGCDGGLPRHCSPGCWAATVPLVEKCGRVLDALLLGDNSTALHALYDLCSTSLTTADVLDILKQKVHDGECSSVDLEGVSNTLVHMPSPPLAECADSRDRCDALIAAGLSCETDFCGECALAGRCDLTCDQCSDHHRRAQTPSTCSVEDFTAESSFVTDACCDVGETSPASPIQPAGTTLCVLHSPGGCVARHWWMHQY
eukprot:COSAG03_NODE_637_length_6585_cov_2.441721_7_plen_281_part_01